MIMIHTPKFKDFNEDLEKYYIPSALKLPSQSKTVRQHI